MTVPHRSIITQIPPVRHPSINRKAPSILQNRRGLFSFVPPVLHGRDSAHHSNRTPHNLLISFAGRHLSA